MDNYKEGNFMQAISKDGTIADMNTLVGDKHWNAIFEVNNNVFDYIYMKKKLNYRILKLKNL